MKSIKAIDLGIEVLFTALTVALLFAAGTARADEAPAAGKVRGIYVEAARGVLVEKRFARGSQGRQVADVELEGRKRVTVQIPAELKAEVGDLVQVSLAQPEPTLARAPIAAPSRATVVAAKWFTPQAEAFDGGLLIAKR